MKSWNKKVFSVVAFAMVLLLGGCVTESKMGNSFKQPTKEDLERAMSLYVQIAYKYLENKNYEKAMTNVKRALDIDKNSPDALNALAVIYQEQGDTEKARETFKKALSKNKGFSDGHLSYGQFLFQQKDFDQACKQFQAAADDDFYTKRATAFFYLGLCLKAASDLPGSEVAFSRCLDLEPNNTSALGRLAAIRFEQQRYSESKQFLDRHVQLVRDSGQVLSAEALWLAIQLERIFGNQNAEASWALFLKNNYPYSKEYLEYQNSLKK